MSELGNRKRSKHPFWKTFQYRRAPKELGPGFRHIIRRHRGEEKSDVRPPANMAFLRVECKSTEGSKDFRHHSLWKEARDKYGGGKFRILLVTGRKNQAETLVTMDSETWRLFASALVSFCRRGRLLDPSQLTETEAELLKEVRDLVGWAKKAEEAELWR